MNNGSPLGDLLRAWHQLDASSSEQRASIAAALGLEWAPRSRAMGRETGEGAGGSSGPVLPAARRTTEERSRKPDSSLSIQVTPQSHASSDPGELLDGPGMQIHRTLEPFLPKEPLLNPNWTRGIFSSRLSQPASSRRIDFPAVVRSALRAEPLLRLPWRQVLSLSKGVRCFIDTGAPLDILLEDRVQVLQALRSLAGFERVSLGFFETLPDGTDATIDPSSEFFAAAEAPLLLLTDFGRYHLTGRRSALPQEWVAFARRERERGTTRIVALTPVPRSEWPAALLQEIEIVLWDWETGVGRSRRDGR